MICLFCITDALAVMDRILSAFLLNEFALMNSIVVRNREPSVLRNVLNYSGQCGLLQYLIFQEFLDKCSDAFTNTCCIKP